MANDAVELDLDGAREVLRAYLDDPKADFHQIVANMAGIERDPAKTVNFGLAYGQGVLALSLQLGLSFNEAKALIGRYHNKVRFMRPLMNYLQEQANKEGEVRTILNRRRHFDRWERFNSRIGKNEYFKHRVPGSQRAFTYRALNARTQGSQADLMKKAMVEIHEAGIMDAVTLTMTIHDELDGSFDPGSKIARQALDEMDRIMINIGKGLITIPLRVDAGVGRNWNEAK